MRYKPGISEQINRCIHDAKIANYTNEGTIRYIQDKTGIKIGRNQLIIRRQLLRRHAKNVWNKYRTDDYEYRLAHLDLMNASKRVRDSATRKMIQYEDKDKDFFKWKSSASTLLDANDRLANLIRDMPDIDSTDRSYNYDEEIEQQKPENGEMANSQRVFS
jgi:hypothetical protein